MPVARCNTCRNLTPPRNVKSPIVLHVVARGNRHMADSVDIASNRSSRRNGMPACDPRAAARSIIPALQD